MGVQAVPGRGLTRARGVSRWLLPAAGAAIGVLLSAQAAHAVVPDVVYTGPASPTTADLLQWSVSTTDNSPTSCRLDRGATVVSPLADCAGTVSYPVSGQPAGQYTLAVFNALASAVPIGATPDASNSVNVAPPKPTVTGPTGPSNDRTPTFTVDEPNAGATLTCAVSGPAPATAPTCAPTTQLDIPGADGPYTLTVTATEAGLTSSSQVTYTLDATVPAPATVTPPTSPDNKTNPAFTITGVEAGASVTCSVTVPSGSPPVTPASCNDTGAQLDLSAAGNLDGDYTLSVVVHDAAGNASTAASATYTLHRVMASAVISPSSATGKSRTPSFTVTDTDTVISYQCAVTDSNGPVPGVVTACGATTTLDLTGKADGPYTLSVTVTDSLGNTSTATATYRLDTTGPSQPSASGSSPASPGNSRSVSWTLTGTEPGETYTCTTGDAGASVACSGSTVTLTLSGSAADGTYTVTVTPHDSLGNSGTPLDLTYDLDATGPSQPSASGSSPASPGNSRSVSWTLTGTETGETYSCAVSGAGASVVCSGSTVTLTLSGSAADGTYTVTVTPRDALGNPGTQLTLTYTLDTTGPAQPSATGPSPASPGNSRSASWTLTGTEPGETYSCSVSGSRASVTCSGSTLTLTLAANAADGTYTVTVTPRDALGNPGIPLTLTYTLDTTGPTQPSATGPSPASPGNSRSVSWTLTGTEPGETYSCVTGDAGASVACSGTTVALALAGTAADGTYTVTVTPLDALGNPGAPLTLTYELDTTPPPAPTVASGSSSPGNGRGPSWSLQDGDRTPVTYTCSVIGPTGFAATVTCGSGSTVALSITAGSPDGLYEITVNAVDAAGNPSASALTIDYVYDTTGPAQPSATGPSPASPGNSRSVSWTLTGTEPGETYSCSVSGPRASVNCSGSTLTLTLAGNATDGTYTVTVTPLDALGNPGVPLTVTYSLDTTGPAQPSVSAPSPASPGNSRSVSWTLTGTEPGETYSCVVSGTGASVTCSGTTLTLTLLGSAADGTYTVTVTPLDVLGNPGVPLTVTYTLDTTGPSRPSASASSPASPGNSRSVSWTLTGTEPGETYSCVVSGTGASVTCSGTTLTLTLLGSAADGTYTVTVTPLDVLGNPGVPLTLTYELDTTAPPAPSVTAPRSPWNNRAPSFTVSDTEAGVHWACVVTGPSAVTVSACGPTTTLNLTGAADGTYTVSVTAIDAAGNVSAATTATYLLDTTPPPAPSVTAPSSPSKDTTPTFGITDAESGVQITCVLTAPGGATAFSGTCPANGTFDTAGYGDGVYVLTVTATDDAGNFSTTSVSWTRDTQPPPTPSVGAPSSPAQSRSPSFTVTDSEAGVTFSCTVTGPAAVPVVGCGRSAILDLTGAPDGTYTLTVTATDVAGNTSTSASATYELDTTAPAAPTVTASPSPAQGKHPSFSVAGVESGGKLTCTLTGPSGSSATIGCSTSIALSLDGQPDGTYTVSVTVTDSAGNISDAGSAGYTLDTTAPSAPVVTAPHSPGKDATPTFQIAAESGATYTCTVARYFQVVFSQRCDGTVDLSGYEDGEFEITFTVTDAAGNVSSPVTVVYVLDTVVPDRPVLTAPASPSPIENPVWLWTAEEGTTATCTITGPTGAVVQGPAECTSPFTGLFRRLPDGVYTLTVYLTDAAGNDSVPVTSVFVLDRRAPVPPTVVPPKSPDNTRHPVWDISAPRGAVLTCTLLRGRTVIFGPAECPADGQFSLVGEPDGTYTLQVTATDSAGNISATSVSTYVLDTVVPEAPQLEYSSSSPSFDTSPYWGFSLPPGATGRCELWHDGALIAVKNGCKGAVSFNLVGRSGGTYTVRIYAVDGAGNTSKALTASYVLGTRSGGTPVPGSGPVTGGTDTSGRGGGGGSNDGGPGSLSRRAVDRVLNQFTNVPQTVRNVAKRATRAVTGAVSSILPVIHDKVTEHVSRAVQGVVDAVSHAGGGTGFPLLLLFVVLAFLLMQNRIDRRDPKLALASVAADDSVEFRPPPSRRAPRAKDGRAKRAGDEGADR